MSSKYLKNCDSNQFCACELLNTFLAVDWHRSGEFRGERWRRKFQPIVRASHEIVSGTRLGSADMQDPMIEIDHPAQVLKLSPLSHGGLVVASISRSTSVSVRCSRLRYSLSNRWAFVARDLVHPTTPQRPV
jgi:hypothetical protein